MRKARHRSAHGLDDSPSTNFQRLYTEENNLTNEQLQIKLNNLRTKLPEKGKTKSEALRIQF